MARNDHVDDHTQVAGAPSAQRRQPTSAHHERLVWLGSGGDLELNRPVHRRHLDRRAERSQRGGNVDRGHEIIAVAQEPWVFTHADQDVQVAWWATAISGVTPP